MLAARAFTSINSPSSVRSIQGDRLVSPDEERDRALLNDFLAVKYSGVATPCDDTVLVNTAPLGVQFREEVGKRGEREVTGEGEDGGQRRL